MRKEKEKLWKTPEFLKDSNQSLSLLFLLSSTIITTTQFLSCQLSAFRHSNVSSFFCKIQVIQSISQKTALEIWVGILHLPGCFADVDTYSTVPSCKVQSLLFQLSVFMWFSLVTVRSQNCSSPHLYGIFENSPFLLNVGFLLWQSPHMN